MRARTSRDPKSLDEKIAAFKAHPRLGDPKWEREWADLLVEKHSKARMPTDHEIARAIRYVKDEFHLGSHISGEQWAEGLAFGRASPEPEDKREASYMFDQLSRAGWLRLAERANHLLSREGDTPRYLRTSSERDRARARHHHPRVRPATPHRRHR